MCIVSKKNSRQGVTLPRHKAENDLNKLSAFLYLAAFYNSLFLLRAWTSGAVRPMVVATEPHCRINVLSRPTIVLTQQKLKACKCLNIFNVSVIVA